ncbi:glyceraldehyde-3-phosphate dehydrogenase [Zhihengliuella somnathii]
MTQQSAAALAEWSDREELAEAMIPLIGRLYRKNNVVTSIYGRKLINKSAVDLLKAHRIARHNDGQELPLEETHPILQAIDDLNLGAASVDIARLARKYKETGNGAGLADFLAAEFGDVVGAGGAAGFEPRDVVLYGFGRIGRLLARILIERGGYGLRLRAIVVRKGSDEDLIKRASLLRRDSVHGPFDGSITVDQENNTIKANGTLIKVIYSSDPSTVDYTEHGIDNAIVVDNTGKWRDRAGLEQHLESKGVSRVLLTAPGKGDVKNIVHGINHGDIEDADTVVSAASCTTNAITPVLKALSDEFGVAHGHVETVHSFTNDQNLIDNFHKGDRRGRSAALNMVITETGAAKAVSKALPEFEGKLTGNAIRVPTPDVSMAILNLNLEREATKEEINTYLRNVSLTSDLHKQIDYIASPEVVSTDFIGSRRAGIVDGLATIANGRNAVVYVWYDNEFGYSCQVIRVIEELAGAHPKSFPAA